ncbi:Kelch repeat-containing protein [Spironucleus salmonicida]|uniref:Kelch repeat-containing protein n=1 Tax=Spironucleus salmonicida TaxID=348837 RepID=V6LDJ1_9EUKA|nr:Kelch repeat-containing protein [Spironucleus salmonicida]|eukprot:EST42552.1 Kelch repeat-containing protein [Spironucleus salmonicida]
MSIVPNFEDLSSEHTTHILQRQHFTTVFYNQTICLFGGHCNDMIYNDTYLFDFTTKQYTKVMCTLSPPARYSHAACLVNHQMFLFGGQDGKQFFNDIWIFDFLTKSWKQQGYKDEYKRVPSIVDHCMAPISDLEILILGGQNQNKKMENQQFIYNVIDATFSVLQMQQFGPEPHIGSTLTKTSKGIIFFGGVGAKGFNNELWRFSTNKKWDLLQPIKQGPIGRAWHQASAIGDDKILIFGGEVGTNHNQKLGDCWVYLINDKGWRKLFEYEHGNALKPDARSGFGQVAWKSRSGNYRVYIFGGNCRDGIKGDFWSVQLAKGFNDENVGIIESHYNQSLIESQGIKNVESNVQIVSSPMQTQKLEILSMNDITSQQPKIQQIAQVPQKIIEQVPNLQLQLQQSKTDILEQCKVLIEQSKQQVLEQVKSIPQNALLQTASSDFNNQMKTFTSKSSEIDVREDISILQAHFMGFQREFQQYQQQISQKYASQQEISNFPAKFQFLESKNTGLETSLNDLKVTFQHQLSQNSLIMNDIATFCKASGRDLSFNDALELKLGLLDDKYKLRLAKVETSIKFFDQELQKSQKSDVVQSQDTNNKSQCEIEELIDHLDVKLDLKITQIEQKLDQLSQNQDIIFQKLKALEFGKPDNMSKSVRFGEKSILKVEEKALQLSQNSSHYINNSHQNVSIIDFENFQEESKLKFQNFAKPAFKQFYIKMNNLKAVTADPQNHTISALIGNDIHQYNIGGYKLNRTSPDETYTSTVDILNISVFNNLLTYTTAEKVIAVPVLGENYEVQPFPSSSTTALHTFSQNNKIFTSCGSSSGLIQLWDHRKNATHLIGAHSENVGILPKISAIQVVNNILYSGDETGQLLNYDVVKQAPISKIFSHSDLITQICVKDDLVTSSSIDGTIRTFDQRSGKSILKAHSKANGVYTDGLILISGGSDGLLRIWDVRNVAKCLHSLKVSKSINSLCVSGNNVICGCDEGIVGIDFE